MHRHARTIGSGATLLLNGNDTVGSLTTTGTLAKTGANDTLTATTYTVTAAGVGSMAGFVYTIDQANTRLTTSTGSWGKASPPNCWIGKKSGDC